MYKYIILLSLVLFHSIAVSENSENSEKPLFLSGEPVKESEAVDVMPTLTVESDPITKAESPLGTSFSGEILQGVAGSGGDPLRGIQSFPGIAVVSDESVAPAIRGSRPGDNIYQVDFLPVGYLFHLGGAISVFNAQLVDKFSLYSSAYGPEFSAANGGVLDVALRDPKTDRFHFTLDANILQTGVLIEGPVTNNQSFYLAGRISYLDKIVKDQLDDDEEGIEYKQFPKYSDYQGKYLWDMDDRGVIKLQFTGAVDKAEMLVTENAKDIENEPDLIGRHYTNTEFNSQGLIWDLPVGEETILKSAIAHYDFINKSVIGNAGDVDVKYDVSMLKTHLRTNLNDSHTLKAGIEFGHEKIDYAIAFNDPGGTEFEPERPITGAERLVAKKKINFNSVHLFVQDNWFVTDNLAVYTGVVFQGEDYLDKSFVEPRLAVEYTLESDWVLSAGLGQYHQMPDSGQVDVIFGNPDLDYIESNHAVVGIEKEFTNGWNWKSDIYYKQLDKLVTADEDDRYANNGEGEAYGFELLVRKELTNRISGWLSFTASKAERKHKITGDKFKFDYDQPVNATLVGQYKLSEQTKLGMKYWVHSGTPYTPVTGGELADSDPERYEPVYGAVNSERLPDFQRLDLRVDHELVSDLNTDGRFKLTGYVELLNALDSKNVDSYDYSKDYSRKKEVYQLPRIISFGIKAEF